MAGYTPYRPADDFKNILSQQTQERKAQAALAKLGSMNGMKAVKDQVEQMVQFSKISKLREQQGLKTQSQSNHMIFTGNPGTGKTTAARLIGEAFSALGLLKSDQEEIPFVEIHHADITHPHVGMAEKAIKGKFEEARGGVLFIDEAYAFINVETSHNTGEKVVAAIVQLMEDLRDEIVVIAAGYPNEMEEFVGANPGLRSRFSNTIHFSDYEVPDLVRIAQAMCSEREYQLSSEFVGLLAARLWAEKSKPGFGNARTVRNIIEQSIRIQSVRVSRIASPSRIDLTLLTELDIHAAAGSLVCEKVTLLKQMQHIRERLIDIDLKEILARNSHTKD